MPAPTVALQEAVLMDLTGTGQSKLFTDVQPIVVQSPLQHAMAKVISDGIVNRVIVTNSTEANIRLTSIHERLFAGGSILNPNLVELAKRCDLSERGEVDRVGATFFPGLVKLARTPPGPGGEPGENTQMVVGRLSAPPSLPQTM